MIPSPNGWPTQASETPPHEVRVTLLSGIINSDKITWRIPFYRLIWYRFPSDKSHTTGHQPKISKDILFGVRLLLRHPGSDNIYSYLTVHSVILLIIISRYFSLFQEFFFWKMPLQSSQSYWVCKFCQSIISILKCMPYSGSYIFT